MRTEEENIELAADWIRNARGLLITAGAGMGVDSGLPDFRGPEGFWRAYPALGEAGLSFQDIAAPHAFKAHPKLAWGFYGHRLALYRRTVPHAGFGILRRWAEGMPEGYRVFTSNVDGHFQRAGFDPDKVHECHGSIHVLQCTVPCGEQTWSADDFAPEVDEARCLLRNTPPRCPRCGSMARPNILMFDDYSWVEERTEESRSGWTPGLTCAAISWSSSLAREPRSPRRGTLANAMRRGSSVSMPARPACAITAGVSACRARRWAC